MLLKQLKNQNQTYLWNSSCILEPAPPDLPVSVPPVLSIMFILTDLPILDPEIVKQLFSASFIEGNAKLYWRMQVVRVQWQIQMRRQAVHPEYDKRKHCSWSFFLNLTLISKSHHFKLSWFGEDSSSVSKSFTG